MQVRDLKQLPACSKDDQYSTIIFSLEIHDFLVLFFYFCLALLKLPHPSTQHPPLTIGFLPRQSGLRRHVILPYSVALKTHSTVTGSHAVLLLIPSLLSSPLFLFTYVTSYVSAI